MKLYLYDHCPYCVRARMIFGLRRVPVQEVFLLNDDEETSVSLIGVKQVPILQKPDGSHMGESLDIVRFINEYAGDGRLDEHMRPAVQAWTERVGTYYNRLLMPRSIQLQLPEFATQAAIDYFVHKKQQNIGSFAGHLAKTAGYLSQIHADLTELESLLPENAAWFNGSRAGMEDILLFPMLRNLSMVQDLGYPPRLMQYLRRTAEQTGIGLYDGRAV